MGPKFEGGSRVAAKKSATQVTELHPESVPVSASNLRPAVESPEPAVAPLAGVPGSPDLEGAPAPVVELGRLWGLTAELDRRLATELGQLDPALSTSQQVAYAMAFRIHHPEYGKLGGQEQAVSEWLQGHPGELQSALSERDPARFATALRPLVAANALLAKAGHTRQALLFSQELLGRSDLPFHLLSGLTTREGPRAAQESAGELGGLIEAALLGSAAPLIAFHLAQPAGFSRAMGAVLGSFEGCSGLGKGARQLSAAFESGLEQVSSSDFKPGALVELVEGWTQSGSFGEAVAVVAVAWAARGAGEDPARIAYQQALSELAAGGAGAKIVAGALGLWSRAGRALAGAAPETAGEALPGFVSALSLLAECASRSLQLESVGEKGPALWSLDEAVRSMGVLLVSAPPLLAGAGLTKGLGSTLAMVGRIYSPVFDARKLSAEKAECLRVALAAGTRRADANTVKTLANADSSQMARLAALGVSPEGVMRVFRKYPGLIGGGGHFEGVLQDALQAQVRGDLALGRFLAGSNRLRGATG